DFCYLPRFDEGEFPAKASDRGRAFGYTRGQIPDERGAARADVATTAEQRVFEVNFDRELKRHAFFEGKVQFAYFDFACRLGECERRVDAGEAIFEHRFTAQANEKVADFFAIDQPAETSRHRLWHWSQRFPIGRRNEFRDPTPYRGFRVGSLQRYRIDD